MQMSERPELNKKPDAATFRSFYYLKRELIDFCKENGLPASGSKAELTDRITYFLNTGKVRESSVNRKAAVMIGTLTEDTVIESNIVCSEKHSAFFCKKIGKSFYFNNGIALLLPEWAVRGGFGVLLLVNGIAFWKRVLPVYSHSFSIRR